MMQPVISGAVLGVALCLLAGCVQTLPTVEAPGGRGWQMYRQGFESHSAVSSSYKSGNTTVTTTAVTHGYGNLSAKEKTTSDDLPRCLVVGTNVSDYTFSDDVERSCP